MKVKTVVILAFSVFAIVVAMTARQSYVPAARPTADSEPNGNPAMSGTNAESVVDEVATAEPPPPLQDFAGECFRTLRERNPRGRILRLNANRLADRCSMVIETDDGSGRWLFDWRDHQAGYVHEGELRWPETWPPEIPASGIADGEFAPERLDALSNEARALWPEQPHADWLYEIIWLPAPFARPLVFITFDDRSEGAADDAALTVIFDGSARLPDADYEQAYALYPLTRFELREDHNFKGPLFESTALAESAVSLEGDPDAGEPHLLMAKTELCMHWLHTVNTGKRVLRVGIDATRCFLLLENGNQRDDYYLLEASDAENYSEHASLILEPLPTPNLLLDRSRLSAARVRERLGQAEAAGGAGLAIERIAIAWVDGAMVWQFDGRRGEIRELVYLDESGTVIDPPGSFPVTVHEREQGFADTRPALPFVAESP